MKGTIERILDKVGKNSGKKYKSFLIDGKWYSYWKEMPENLMVSSVIDFEYDTRKVGDMTFATITSLKVEGQPSGGNVEDIMTPIGNLYAMCEEKLNGIIEQQALLQTQLANLTNLVMEIATKLGIDINSYKPASEV